MTEPALNAKYMEMMKLLNIYLNHFPTYERYGLASRIRNTAYDLYDKITEGQKRYFKKTTLTDLDIIHEQLRMQAYLAYELGYFGYKDGRRGTNGGGALEQKRYIAISRQIDELGRMIGGWIKSIKDANQWK
jgi:hypothetical protein